LLVARLENKKNFHFLDLMVNYGHGRGEFNLAQAETLNYLIHLKIIQNQDKTGVGLAIYSRRQDRLVFLRYSQVVLNQGEKEILNATGGFGFNELGFAKLTEFEVKRHLLDLRAWQGTTGQTQYFFFYPDEIVIYRAGENRLERETAFKLNWQRPYYPTLEYEGRLLLLGDPQKLYLVAGANFSAAAPVFTPLGENGWQKIAQVDFVPFAQILLNGTGYLVGARYQPGQNFFQDQLVFLPYRPGDFAAAKYYEKSIFPFYDLAIASPRGDLESVQATDLTYHCHFFSGNFEELVSETTRTGASLAIIDNRWLVSSDYTTVNDRLLFFDIQNGSRRLVYESKVDGEVRFLTAGIWNGISGCWAYLKVGQDDSAQYRLQFWGKKGE